MENGKNGKKKRNSEKKHSNEPGEKSKVSKAEKADYKGASPKIKHPTQASSTGSDTSSDVEVEMEWRPAKKESKRKRHSTSGEHTPSLSVDEKFDCIMSKLSTLTHIEKQVNRMDKMLSDNLTDVKEIRADIKEFELKIKTLEYKALDQEARSRRNNLLFWGIPESNQTGEDCEALVKDFIHSNLHISSDMIFQRAHRLGSRHTGKPRPVIVCFRDFKDVESIMKVVGTLRGTSKGVSRDFPNEIHAARKSMYPKLKQYKSQPGNTVSLQYPAKIVVNGTTVEDAFPNWHHFLNKKYERTTSEPHLVPHRRRSHENDVHTTRTTAPTIEPIDEVVSETDAEGQ